MLQPTKTIISKSFLMKIKGFFLSLALIAGISLSSCYYDKADLLYPTSTVCDSIPTISYAQHVAPLLQQHCYGCHAGSSPSGGIAMGNYATDKAIALNGKLYGSISYAPGYLAMPEGSAKFSTCQLAIVKRWIDANSPNN